MNLREYALALIGKPYIWGGSGADGFDCSGFVIECLQAFGILPNGDWTSQTLLDRFEKLKYAKVRKTEIKGLEVCFWGKERATHCSIALDEDFIVETEYTFNEGEEVGIKVKKEDIKVDITDGYLTINAKTSHEKNEGEKGKFVRRERFMGECSRSFYVGEDIEQDDIKASFKNGILSLDIPKVDPSKKEEEKKYIEIND